MFLLECTALLTGFWEYHNSPDLKQQDFVFSQIANGVPNRTNFANDCVDTFYGVAATDILLPV
jgi:hypothetical protein